MIMIMSRGDSMGPNKNHLVEEEFGDKKKEDGSSESIMKFLRSEVRLLVCAPSCTNTPSGCYLIPNLERIHDGLQQIN